MNMQPTDKVVAASVANVAGPSAAKVITQRTAASVPATTCACDYTFLAICPGLLPKDTAIIA